MTIMYFFRSIVRSLYLIDVFSRDSPSLPSIKNLLIRDFTLAITSLMLKGFVRSEERRVGKECSSRRAADHDKERQGAVRSGRCRQERRRDGYREEHHAERRRSG